MAAARIRVGLLAAALVACGPSSEVFVPSPPVDGAEAIFVALTVSVDYRVFAYDVDDDPIEIDLRDVDPGEAVRIEVVPVDFTLADFSLGEGEVEPATGAMSEPLPLADDAISFTTIVEDRKSGEWAEQAVSPRLRGFRIDNSAQCPPLALIGREEVDILDFDAIIEHPASRVLVRSRRKDFEGIRIDSTFDVLAQTVVQSPVSFSIGGISRDDEPWIATSTMAYEVDFADGFIVTTATEALPPNSEARVIVIGDDAIFTQDRLGKVWRTTRGGGPHELLAELEDTRGGGLFVTPMAVDWSTGRVVTGNSTSNQTVLWDNGVVELPRFTERGVRTLIYAPGMNTFVAGTIDGTFYELVDNRWRIIPRAIQDDSQIRAMAPLGDGFVYVQGDGMGFHNGRAFCPEGLPGSDVRFLSSWTSRLNIIVDGDPETRRRAIIEVRNLDAL